MNERKIVKYKVAFESQDCAFDDTVNSLIEEGWQPFGGICVTFDEVQISFDLFQAMVKYEDIE